jgi:site-specific DNA-cytosine methylase
VKQGRGFAYLLLFQLVRSEELEALLRHRGGEALTAASQVVEHLLERDVFLHRHKKETRHKLRTVEEQEIPPTFKDNPRSGEELLHGREQKRWGLGRKKEGGARIKIGRKRPSRTTQKNRKQKAAAANEEHEHNRRSTARWGAAADGFGSSESLVGRKQLKSFQSRDTSGV